MKFKDKLCYTCLVVLGTLLSLAFYWNENPPSTLVNHSQFQEFEFWVGEDYPLEGVLTLPKGVEQAPVVLLVQGSGQSDKNESTFLNKPFQDLAHGLAKLGVASLRYDKRYYAYPSLAEEKGASISYEDEILEDVASAIKLLSHEENLGSIFVLGHSLGGMLTPAIASLNPEVEGIISMAGSPLPLYEISYSQNKAVEELFFSQSHDLESIARFTETMAQVEEEILILRGDFSHLSQDSLLLGLPVAYQLGAREYAGENFLPNLELPILIIQGSEDFQVTYETGFSAYQELLRDKENATFLWYEGLNHFMMPSSGVATVEDYYPKNTVDTEVIADIVAFIKNGI